MLRWTERKALKYIAGVRAVPGGSAASLLDEYLQNGEARSGANVPASQRYFYEKKREPAHAGGVSGLSQRHTLAQLRLGDAQLLTSTEGLITNLNEGHPLFFAQTSPRAAGLCVSLVLALKDLRIRRLTELQGALIPLMLKGKHVIAHSETGTGKSFGMALAIANRIIRGNLNYRLHTVVLVPTEELALQYDKWFRHFGGCTSQVVQAAIESIPLEAQLAKLHNIQPHVLVGTPQRVADIARLSPTIIGEKLRRKVDCVVLDEADLILATEVTYGRHMMSGTNLVERIFRTRRDEVPAQLVAASATVDGVTAQALNSWTRNDRAVRLTTSFVEHTIPPTISFYFYPESTQYPLIRGLELVLRLICRQCHQPRILIFTASHEVRPLCDSLEEKILPVIPEAQLFLRAGRKPRRFADLLHSLPEDDNHSHVRRAGHHVSISARQIIPHKGDVYVRNNSSLAQLNEGNLMIGVGSYEVSRGLHVNGITHVILYGMCSSSTSFVHCAGRTGRMGSEGDVIVLFPPSAGRAVQQVCRAVELSFKTSKLEHVEHLLDNQSFATAESLAAVKAANDEQDEQGRRRKLEVLQRDISSADPNGMQEGR